MQIQGVQYHQSRRDRGLAGKQWGGEQTKKGEINKSCLKRRAGLLRNAQAQMPYVVDVIDTGTEILTIIGRKPEYDHWAENRAKGGNQP